jgi:Flp pilus assembly protein TadB
MIESKEYIQFKNSFKPRISTFYEKLCNNAERIVVVKPPEDMRQKLQKAIDFCHLEATPEGCLTLAVLFIIGFLALTTAIFMIGLLQIMHVILFIVFAIGFGYYIMVYPYHVAKSYRIKASSDIMLAIVYMVVSMKSTPNLENAVKFAAENLTGPLGFDFKKLLWDVEVGVYTNVISALQVFEDKWKENNEEFVKSIDLLINSLYQAQEKRDRMLDEAINVILTGTADRMNKYARDLVLPTIALHMIGIILPVLIMVIFPMITIFLGGFVNIWSLVIGYDVVMPLMLYMFLQNIIQSRPVTFSPVDISDHPESQDADNFMLGSGPVKTIMPTTPTALLVAAIVSIIGIALFVYQPVFKLSTVISSSLVIIGISLGIIVYCYGKSYRVLKIQEEIESVEKEFDEAIYQLGYRISTGAPLETALKNSSENIKQFKIKGLFDRCISNMENLSMTFERSLFDDTSGALKYYPSKMIKAMMKIVAESVKKGMNVASEAMLTIHKYLRNMHYTQEKIEDLLEETVSSLKFNAYILVPAICGIVVAMSQIVMSIMVILMEKMQQTQGVTGVINFNPIPMIVDFKNTISPTELQLVIGIYFIELSVIMGSFIIAASYGENPVKKKYLISKILIIGIVLYIITMVMIGSVFSGLIESIIKLGVTT